MIPFRDLKDATQSALNLLALIEKFEALNLHDQAAVATRLVGAVMVELDHFVGGPVGEQPGDGGGMSEEERQAILAMFSVAFDASGAAAFITEKDAFLVNVLSTMSQLPSDEAPSSQVLRILLDAAMVAYSDSDGDGQANLPLLPDEVVFAFWQSLLDQGLLDMVQG